MIEGKAIHLHPLVCTALSTPTLTVTRWQCTYHWAMQPFWKHSCLMLSSHNILNPAKWCSDYPSFTGHGIGLYYITKGRKSDSVPKMLKEKEKLFYSAEEVNCL
jgi:DNA-directed RNA polymerase subunit beta'